MAPHSTASDPPIRAHDGCKLFDTLWKANNNGSIGDKSG